MVTGMHTKDKYLVNSGFSIFQANLTTLSMLLILFLSQVTGLVFLLLIGAGLHGHLLFGLPFLLLAGCSFIELTLLRKLSLKYGLGTLLTLQGMRNLLMFVFVIQLIKI